MAAGTDSIFGGFLLNPIDGNSYLAKMYQGWQGEWRFTLPYTARPGEGAYLFLFYLFLGHLARLTRLPLLVMFHLARLLSALVLVFAVRRFLFVSFSVIPQPGRSNELVDDSGNRGQSSEFHASNPALIPHFELIFGLATLGLGLGWLAFPFGLITSDLWVPEAYPFLSAYSNPHFSLGLALLLWLLSLPPGERNKDEEPKWLRTLREPRQKNKISPPSMLLRYIWVSLRGASCTAKQSPGTQDQDCLEDNARNDKLMASSFSVGRESIPGSLAKTLTPGKGQKIRSGISLGMASLLLSVISPFGVIVALVVLGVMAAWEFGERLNRTRRSNPGAYSERSSAPGHSSDITLRWIWVFLFGAPLLLYDLWVARLDPILAGWNAQNLTPSPPLWDLLLSFSPALFLALVGVSKLWRTPDRRFRLLLTWIGLGVVLVYLPFGLQRRFMMGLFVPVVGLAGYVLIRLESEKHRLASILGKLVLILSLPTTLLVILIGQYGAQERAPLLYLTRGEAQALKWIEDNTQAEALILASPETGMFIPAHTGRRVIYGHPYETVNAEAEKQAVILFFQEAKTNQPFIQAFLSDREVDYVFYGPRERQLGSLFEMDSLIPVFSTDGVDVYQYLR